MRNIFITALGLAPAIAGAGLIPGEPGGPVLSTPGSATWSTEPIDTGVRAIYTITADTVLDWGQLEVPFGNELIFDFVGGGGNSIANMLGGGTTHSINGAVISNGNVGFFAPNSDININGSITGASVTIATLGVDAADYLDGGSLAMQGSGGLNFLSVTGSVSATQGDVVLAGSIVDLDATANLSATRAVRIGAGDHIELAASGSKRLQADGGLGFVLNLGKANASTIEISSNNAISNGGRLQTSNGLGQIFLMVGPGGQITNEGTGLLIGAVAAAGAFVNDGASFTPDEGDSLIGVSPSTLNVPTLRRPDGSTVKTPGVMRSTSPMTASSDAGRLHKRTTIAMASNTSSLVKRASFFGMRGGNAAPKKPKSPKKGR